MIQLGGIKALRLKYDDIKHFKIKHLLGILKVPNCDRRGVRVLNTLFRPNQEVQAIETAFQLSNDINFVHLKVSTESELFFDEINSETTMSEK